MGRGVGESVEKCGEGGGVGGWGGGRGWGRGRRVSVCGRGARVCWGGAQGGSSPVARSAWGVGGAGWGWVSWSGGGGRRMVARAEDPRGAKVGTWYRLSRQDPPASFDEIAAFIDANPDWPEGARLRRRDIVEPDLVGELYLHRAEAGVPGRRQPVQQRVFGEHRRYIG